jgi:hypothetical protein
MASKSPLQQLYDGELPKMVRWYDPRLLVRIGIRTMVSSVFGQYADQRLIQAATDADDKATLVARYDFCDCTASDPLRRIDVDEQGAFWIDYVADIGDGFEPTYAMAYLLAKESLAVGSSVPLTHGSILIMGGDQCYPQATREDYKRRLQLPYGWAFNVAEPTRKLFAIPGNHDWYDGLQAFDSLFCASRDRLSESKGNTIGGWRCMQHRSYWALRLPHKWWIWGADIQFSKYLDAAQVNYFETMAAEMGPEDKLVICLAEPSWMLADLQGADEEENFFKITTIARKRGARIVAVVAGDWHHYARYTAPELGVHFFTAGGGGSFLHPTHVLKNEISVSWPERTTRRAAPENPIDAKLTQGWERHEYGVRLKRPKSDKSRVEEAVGEVVEEVMREAKETIDEAKDAVSDVKEGKPAPIGPRRQRRLPKPIKYRAPKCYPSRGRSWLLSLRNLAFPIFNFPFALGIGLIYWLVTWQFHSVARQFDISAGKIDHAGLDVGVLSLVPWMPVYVLQATLSMSFAFMLLLLYGVLVAYVEGVERPGLRRYLVKFTVGTAHFIAHLFAMFTLFLAFLALNNNLAPQITAGLGQLMQESEQRPGVVGGIVKETLEPLSKKRQAERRATGEKAPPPRSGPIANAEPDTVRELVGLLYPFQMAIAGALVGGFIWGLYWTLTGLLGRMHAEDSFAALRIKDYKNFLRMKFEPDQLTIYPVGIDRIPRKSDWMTAPDSRPPDGQNAALIPVKPIPVHLIEEPIVIRPGELPSA